MRDETAETSGIGARVAPTTKITRAGLSAARAVKAAAGTARIAAVRESKRLAAR